MHTYRAGRDTRHRPRADFVMLPELAQLNLENADCQGWKRAPQRRLTQWVSPFVWKREAVRLKHCSGRLRGLEARQPHS